MFYYIHGITVQTLDTRGLNTTTFLATVKNATFPGFNNPTLPWAILNEQLRQAHPDAEYLRKDMARGMNIHGQPHELATTADTMKILQQEFPLIDPEVIRSLSANYSQGHGSFFEIYACMEPTFTLHTKARFVSCDSVPDSRGMQRIHSATENIAHAETPANKLFIWNMNYNFTAYRYKADFTPYQNENKIGLVPGFIGSQYHVNKNDVLPDYVFCTNRLLYDYLTLPPFAITPERIVEAEAEEKFNLDVYFPLKVAARQLAERAHAKAGKLQQLVTLIETEEQQTAHSTGKFISLLSKYQPEFLAVMAEINHAALENTSEEKSSYTPLQADDRCMVMAILKNQINLQVDKPINAILQHIDQLKDKTLDELKMNLRMLRDGPYHLCGTVLIGLSEKSAYDQWVIQYLTTLASYADNLQRSFVELENKENETTRLSALKTLHAFMLDMIRLATSQQLAHKEQYQQNGIELQHEIDATFTNLTQDDDPLPTSLERQPTIYSDSAGTGADSVKTQLTPEFLPTMQHGVAPDHFNLPKDASEQPAPVTIEKPEKPRKLWPWALLAGIFLLGTIALSIFPLPLIGELASYCATIGIAFVGGATLRQALQKFDFIKWAVRLAGMIGVLGILALNLVPGVGQAVTSVLLLVGFVILSGAGAGAAGFAFSNFFAAKAKAVTIVATPTLPPAPPAAPMHIERQRPDKLFEFDYEPRFALTARPVVAVTEEKVDEIKIPKIIHPKPAPIVTTKITATPFGQFSHPHSAKSVPENKPVERLRSQSLPGKSSN